MDKEPYIYTMPESFMLDDSVPAWWRLLGILNGFWLNHLPFYASNEWIMQRLRCSEPTVSNAIKKLEELQIIKCVRKGRNDRSILPFKLQSDPNQLGSRPKSTLVADPNQLIHNSDSNSDSKILSANAEKSPYQPIDQDGNLIEKKIPKTQQVGSSVLGVFGLFREINPAWGSWRAVPAQREAAKALLAKYSMDKIKTFLEASQRYKEDPYAPLVNSPYDLLNKLAQLRDYENRRDSKTD